MQRGLFFGQFAGSFVQRANRLVVIPAFAIFILTVAAHRVGFSAGELFVRFQRRLKAIDNIDGSLVLGDQLFQNAVIPMIDRLGLVASIHAQQGAEFMVLRGF
ncbi:MAG: hypothetical protein LRZ88_05160 [Candidatus Cloacimonetes bacterium]|nr:hypothetical protein [Candidatus Cloacimonadota bacterium]